MEIVRCVNCGSIDFIEDGNTQIVSCWHCGTSYMLSLVAMQESVDESG